MTLGLTQFRGLVSPTFVREVFAADRKVEYRSPEDLYRAIWKWDKVAWGSHTNVCQPGSCPFRVYVKNGIVWREEQVAHNDAVSPKYPDYNPLGCQKGCSFHTNIYGEERVKHPLKRVGERGEGKWKRISWDEALTEVAESIVDAIEEQGPDAFVIDPPHMHIGPVGSAAVGRFGHLLGTFTLDGNTIMGDFNKGFHDVIGNANTGFTADNVFDAELIFLSSSNWSYTMIPIYHFLSEARYNGAEIVAVNPDYNPTSIVADYHAPVRQGCDAAFWLGIAKVIVDENLVDAQFVKEQTDLPLLVRKDDGRYLRQPDLEGEGREDQLYFYDLKTKRVVKAPRGTLRFDGDQALEGTYEVTLKSGETVEVTPVFEQVKKRLEDYTPEKAAEKCGVHASLIRKLGQKVGTKVTFSFVGFTSAKTYHGDLAERAMLLALGLSGNWGKPGTGWNMFAVPLDHIMMLSAIEKPVREGGILDVQLSALGSPALQKVFSYVPQWMARRFFDAMQSSWGQSLFTRLMSEDPDATDEIIATKMMVEMGKMAGIIPPAFFLYYHCGYKEAYDNPAWQDPQFPRTFTDCLNEGIEKGWWAKEQIRPAPEVTPRVFLMAASNPMRRVRSAAVFYPKHLFPKLRKIVAIEPRMSYSAMHADIVLPAAWYYEKYDMTMSITGTPRICCIEEAVKPPGEAKPEWDIFAGLMEKIVEVTRGRKLETFRDFFGRERRYDELGRKYTMDGRLMTQEDALREMVDAAEATGLFPKGMTYEDFRKAGNVVQQGLGNGWQSKIVANEWDPKKPFFSLRWHVDDKKVYATYSRRAQFLIDHPWYLEADEHLPRWKEPPKIGGDHPFVITGGHPRHSVHSIHLSQASLLRLHRGQPVMHMNNRDAERKGIGNGDIVRVFNDFSDFEIMVRISPTVQPGQVIVYFWEGYQFRKWKVYDRLLIGQPKLLHLVNGYGHLAFYMMCNGPAPSNDRGVRVDVEAISVAKAVAGVARGM